MFMYNPVPCFSPKFLLDQDLNFRQRLYAGKVLGVQTRATWLLKRIFCAVSSVSKKQVLFSWTSND